MAPIDLPSPCIAVCRLNAKTGFCDGCYRTAQEISVWPTADQGTRMAILEQLKARRLAGGGGPRRRRRRAASAGGGE